ncbi:hypothetical protein RUM44_000950 [Polyplax serrata]|uniref:Uncharacterized protein n=1 Tax=Polyplax serrata TaxID=468196 RepID=A0ABR1B7E6_POLSC
MYIAKEKVFDYIKKILGRFKLKDLEEIINEFFDVSVPHLRQGILAKKLTVNSSNLTQILLARIEKEWNTTDILMVAFELQLEHTIRHSSVYKWTANKLIGQSKDGEITNLPNLIKSTIRKSGRDAHIFVKKAHELLWISISMKNLKTVGIYERPHCIVLTLDGKYFFNKDLRSLSMAEYFVTALGYDKSKPIKLSGRSLPSLVKLLHRSETADKINRPLYEKGELVETVEGFDFTQAKSFYNYYDKCVDGEDINLQSYTITSISPWLGDDTEVLRKLEFKSAITLTGDVQTIIRQLPVASIVKPPIPNYLRNYSIKGRNVVSLKTVV